MPSKFGGTPTDTGAQQIMSVFDSPEYQDTPKSKFSGVYTPKPNSESRFGGTPAARPVLTGSKFGGEPAKKEGTFLGDLGESLKNRLVSKPLSDTGQYIKENFKEGAENVINPAPVKVPNESGAYGQAKFGAPMKNKPDVEAPVLTQLKRPLGAAQALTSPMFALEHGYISKPVEEATGGKIKADWIDLLRMFTPAAAGVVGGAASRVKDLVVPEKEEQIAAAAVKDKAGNVTTGANHDEAYIKTGKKGRDGSLTEGFKTSKGRFVDRKEGLQVAQKAKQAPAQTLKPGELHSEDVATALGTDPKKGIPQKEPNLLQRGAKVIESIFSPTTMSPEAGKTEAAIREARGQAERSTAQAQHQVDGLAREINALPPEQQRDFVNYIETRSKGGKLANPALQKAADTIRDIYQKVRTRLENSPHTEKMGFIQDYFVHQWKDPKKAQAFINEWVSKAGNAKNTKQRTIPTIAEGIKAGLVPVHDNPLDATMSYVGNMNNYLALKETQANLAKQGLRKFFPEGKQPPGWVELKGPGNQVAYASGSKEKGLQAGVNKAYAPEDVARVYNNYYSPGFTGRVGDLYRGLRAIANGPTQLLLGLSGYHYRLIANEATASALAEGIGQAARGDAGVGKSLAKSTPYAGAIALRNKGQEFENQYLGLPGSLDEKIIDYITRANARVVGIDKTLKSSQSNNFWEAWKKGTLKTELKAAGSSIGGFVRGVGKLMDTAAYPLFVETIPKIKNAVNYDGLADWIKAHPQASEEEILKATRDIVDSTDNRFGEMVQDNIFWDKKLKQALQLMVISIGWDLGTAREMVGGSKDLASFVAGKGELSPRAKYVIAAPIAHMLNASVYQYIKTGQGPQVPQDLVYPRTGGEVTESPGTKYAKKVPERLAQPSQMKDVIAYQEDPLGELKNKLNPVWRIALDMATNSDWRGDPIAYQFEQNAPSGVKAYAQYIMKAFSPISAQNIENRRKGTNIGPIENIMGSRPTGMQGRDPEGFRKMKESEEKTREKKAVNHQRREKSQLENSGN